MGPSVLDIFLGVFPMLLLVGAWFFFMRVMTRPGGPQSKQLEMQERQVKALERIADALERRTGA